MFCTNCGAQIPDGAARCPSCGAPQNAPVNPAPQQPYTPPQAAQPQQPYTPPQQSYTPPQQPYNGPRITPPKNNGACVAALVLAILSFLCLGPITGIPALIVGLVGLSKIKKTGERGKGMAITGVVVGILNVLGVLVWFLLLALGVMGSILDNL